MNFINSIRIIFFLLFFFTFSHPFYLPEVSPSEFEEGEKLPIHVNSLISSKTGLPYDYYALPWCSPPHLTRLNENIGALLSGDRVYDSLYEATVLKTETCKVWCKKSFTRSQIAKFSRLIQEEYRVQWIVDNLPAVTPNGERFEFGFPLGQIISIENKKHRFINNHVTITIKYHNSEQQPKKINIVGIEVIPMSIKHSEILNETLILQDPLHYHQNVKSINLLTCEKGKLITSNYAKLSSSEMMSVDSPDSVIFTYDVVWKESEITWESRWNIYLHTPDADVHWFSIVNSLMIVLLLTGVIAMIMTRILRRDIARYNDESRDPDVDETGWKQLHGDVFRPPDNYQILSVLIGIGIQLFVMVFVIMIFAALGFLSPVNRGGLLTATFTLSLFASVFSGYYSARFLKFFSFIREVPSPERWSREWKRCTYQTVFFLPVVVFIPTIILTVIASQEGSSMAIPFSTLCLIFLLWIGIATPLAFIGSYFGNKKQIFYVPCPPNEIARDVFFRVWYLHPIFCIAIGGLLPFGAVFVELFFILGSVWLHQVYHVFGFLFIVFVILLVTCAEITIVLCYFQLCSLDYEWWWRSFYTSGACSFYMFFYSCFYFYYKLEFARFSSIIIFFGYTTVASFLFFLLTGTVGFIATFVFVQTIYSAIKVE
eukprot:c19304_g1_i1.p1 GENE.c19304_g1_i1~~c19304_g1_i1.p1  ORF type:complete len:656 (-),score=188.42 c19304_g1_i1:25-1992(-)